MMAAAQPFISGAISKTINLPTEATIADVGASYRLSWELGLKANALYRDGSKLSQPLNTKTDVEQEDEDMDGLELDSATSITTTVIHETLSSSTQIIDRVIEVAATESIVVPSAVHGEFVERVVERVVERIIERPLRRRLPETRGSITHKFNVAGHEGYLIVGLYEDGRPGELFITMAKEGSTIGGLMDGIGTLTSLALQYGVPLDALVRKFAHVRFEPSGYTKNPDIRNAASITDYVFRWMAMQFVPGYREANTPNRNQPELAIPGLQEEVKKKINRPVRELPLAEDTEVVSVKSGRDGNGKGHSPAVSAAPAPATRSVKSLSDSVAHFQQDAPTCPICGHITHRNGACYKCQNCGESLGCS
jgi:ribonucleoside-diphosphate reductase alpha chain